MINFIKKLFGRGKVIQNQEKEAVQTRSAASHDDEIVREMVELIFECCDKKPSFKITKNTNFYHDLHFDGIDMSEIMLKMETKFNVKFPEGSSFFQRSADDTDYTVGELLEVYGLLEQKGVSISDSDRYYFYNERCSFKLPKEQIMQDNVEKNGLKHTLMTSTMIMTILEIRPGMPNFPSTIQTKNITVAGYPCLAAKVNPLLGEYDHYYINCEEFVVQVTMTMVNEDFLNSFRLEKKK